MRPLSIRNRVEGVFPHVELSPQADRRAPVTVECAAHGVFCVSGQRRVQGGPRGTPFEMLS